MNCITDAQHRRLRILLEGPVHGIGLRPTMYRIAQRLHLKGWVRNFNAGIEIEVEGGSDEIQKFVCEMELQLSSAIEPIKETFEQIASLQSAWFEILPDSTPNGEYSGTLEPFASNQLSK